MAATNNLFPVFDIPVQLADDVPSKQRFRPSPLFDYESGEFVLDGSRRIACGSGFDAWVLWCLKTILTQRWAHYGYSSNAGIEANEAFAQIDRDAAQSTFERTITEALLADPMGRTAQVRNFRFAWQGGDSLFIDCDVVGVDGNSATIHAPIRQ